jgi:hypothetical protein
MITWWSSTTIRCTTSCNTFCWTVKEGSSIVHSLPDTGAKGLDAFAKPELCTPLAPLLSDFPSPFSPHPSVVVNSSTALRQFGQVDHLGLRGVNEPRHFALKGGELALQAYAFLFRAAIHRGVPTPVRILRPQHRRVREQNLHVPPDAGLNQRRTEAAPRARPRRIPRITQGTDRPAALRAPGPHQPPATAPTHQEPP